MVQSTNLKAISLLEELYAKVFGVVDNEFDIRFSKLKMADLIWLPLYLKNVSMFVQLSQVIKKTLPQGFSRRW